MFIKISGIVHTECFHTMLIGNLAIQGGEVVGCRPADGSINRIGTGCCHAAVGAGKFCVNQAQVVHGGSRHAAPGKR